jgi:hypothetical protein
MFAIGVATGFVLGVVTLALVRMGRREGPQPPLGHGP